MTEANLHALYNSTVLLLDRAREMVRNGDKDTARLIGNYIFNGRIPELISGYKFEALGEPDWALLRWKTQNLLSDCHPSVQFREVENQPSAQAGT